MRNQLRVLFQARPDLLEAPGGDTVQIRKTKSALEEKGVNVDLSLDLRADVKDYDIVHLFNITRVHETYVQALNAKEQGKPIVLSTIYWNMSEYERYANKFSVSKRLLYPMVANDRIRQELLRARDVLMRKETDPALKLQRKMGFKSQQLEVLKMADVWLPNAESEYELIKRDFNVDKPYVVVPNAADQVFADAEKTAFVNKHKIEDFVLAVGNMAIRKNHLSLIRALKDTGLKLVIIGRLSTVESKYASLCLKEAENVIFIEYLDHDLLPSAYAAAKVHVQPSWYETPGLASLEAGLAGCNIAITDRGSTKEYFSSYAWYCDPSDISSIYNAVLAAYEAPRSDDLREHVLANYTWHRAAEVTIKAYRMILGMDK